MTRILLVDDHPVVRQGIKQVLAGAFHPYYKAHRVITDDRTLTAARLGLCAAVGQVVANGLGLLGVAAPASM